jgi:hypothetical protein
MGVEFRRTIDSSNVTYVGNSRRVRTFLYYPICSILGGQALTVQTCMILDTEFFMHADQLPHTDSSNIQPGRHLIAVLCLVVRACRRWCPQSLRNILLYSSFLRLLCCGIWWQADGADRVLTVMAPRYDSKEFQKHLRRGQSYA